MPHQPASQPAGAKVWAETILDMYKNIPRINRLEEIRTANYDIYETVKQLENIYTKAVNEEKQNENITYYSGL